MVGLTSPGLMPSLQPPVPLPRAPGNASLRLRTAVLELNNVTIGTGLDHSKHIGRLTLRLSTPSLTMIVGPVGCGKSILLKTILGEIEPVEGEISISDLEVAYCGQLPWIVNKSIRENIIAGSRCYDGEWYRSIIHACCLDDDLREMPVGDNTLIGRQGTKLSKGQRQRIFSPPRAEFSDHHLVNHLPQADLVIAFGEDGLEIGTFRELQAAKGDISKLYISERPRNSREENIATDEMAAKRRMTRGAANIEDQTRETNGLAIYATAVVWPKAALLLGFLVMEAGLGVLRYGQFCEQVSSILKGQDSVDTDDDLGRFSEDMGLIDKVLPCGVILLGFREFSSNIYCIELTVFTCAPLEAFPAIAQVSVVIATVPHIAVAVPFLVGILILSHSVAKTKASLLSHFMDSYDGLVTIRSFGWTSSMSDTTYYLLDTAQRPYYHLICIQRWLVLIIDLIVAALAVLLIGLAVAIKSPIDPGMLGAGLLMMTMLGQNLSGIILSWTSIEPSLSAISRLKHFVEDTPRELRHRNVINPGVWPAQGAIEFRDVSVSHDSTSDPVLRNITFTLQPGQKLGLCGRTEGQVLFLIM
ncbi:unnamed protein product [Aspergillus oryzae]|nr:unnamed protein product [Aspergillus oryzae]